MNLTNKQLIAELDKLLEQLDELQHGKKAVIMKHDLNKLRNGITDLEDKLC